MTPANLISELATRGVEFQAHGDKLRYRPAERLTPTDVEAIRRHKSVILKLLRAEGHVFVNPAADPRPLMTCDRCESTEVTDVPIHGGQSLRRDCVYCRRFLGWPRWYGRTFSNDTEQDQELRHED